MVFHHTQIQFQPKSLPNITTTGSTPTSLSTTTQCQACLKTWNQAPTHQKTTSNPWQKSVNKFKKCPTPKKTTCWQQKKTKKLIPPCQNTWAKKYSRSSLKLCIGWSSFWKVYFSWNPIWKRQLLMIISELLLSSFLVGKAILGLILLLLKMLLSI